jgi:hypothetical protein
MLTLAGQRADLRRVTTLLQLKSGTWYSNGSDLTVCFNLPKGKSSLNI